MGEHLLCKQGVAGSNPAVSTSPCVASVCDGSPPPESGEKANAHPLADAAEAFLLTKRIAGCTDATLQIYGWWLRPLQAEVSTVTPLAMRTFFVGLQHRSASHQHQAYRTLKTFFRWCVETCTLTETPLRGFTMRTPKTLPDVPTEDELRAVLAACPETLEGVPNRAILLVLADSGLRAGEVLRLLVEDWRPSDRGLFVRAGELKEHMVIS